MAQPKSSDRPGPSTPRTTSLRIDPALVERWLVRIPARRARRRGATSHSGRRRLRRRRLRRRRVSVRSRARAAKRPRGPHAVQHLEPDESCEARPSSSSRRPGIDDRVVDITAAVDGYLRHEPDAGAQRRGNVMARVRMIVLFDQSAKIGGLPIGTGNKSERLLRLFHLARRRFAADQSHRRPLQDPGVGARAPSRRPASHHRKAGDRRSHPRSNRRRRPRHQLRAGPTASCNRLSPATTSTTSSRRASAHSDVSSVSERVDATHWKRHLPTTAMVSATAINEFYLRPVDY